MAFSLGEVVAVNSPGRRIQGRDKRIKIGNAFVNLHPRGRAVAAIQAPWRLAAVRRHQGQQRVDPGCR